MNCVKENLLLYVVTDRSWLAGRSLEQVVKLAIEGGATMVQLREKELNAEEFLAEAKKIAAQCKACGLPFIVNDKVETALACGADGVHVGQSDMDALNVRERLGPDKIIGVSAQTVEQARLAQASGADYLGVGAVFATSTKRDADDVSFETLKAICQAVSIPVVAIGGIYADNIEKLAGSGIAGVALVSSIFAEPDITVAAKKMRSLSEKTVNSVK